MNNKPEQKVVSRKYSPQFKDQTLERIAKDGVPQLAKDLGLAESLLYSWKSINRRSYLKLKKSLSEVSVFSGRDQPTHDTA